MTLSVPYVSVNAYGHVTGYGTHTHTITIPFSSLPGMYWADIRVSDTSSTDKEPTFKTTRIKNDEYIGTASGTQCHLKYDTTDNSFNFIFD